MNIVHKCLHPSYIAFWCVILLITLVVIGCSRHSSSSAAALSRDVARAAKIMSESAQLGTKALMDTQYKERDPNPNPYVGELLYGRYCASCHQGGKGPNILENRVTAPDAESDYYIIRYGLIEMKGFRNKLTKFQTLDILAYMKVDLTDFKPSDGMFSPQKTTSKKAGSSPAAKDTDEKTDGNAGQTGDLNGQEN